jgi:hypothetical protein
MVGKRRERGNEKGTNNTEEIERGIMYIYNLAVRNITSVTASPISTDCPCIASSKPVLAIRNRELGKAYLRKWEKGVRKEKRVGRKRE